MGRHSGLSRWNYDCKQGDYQLTTCIECTRLVRVRVRVSSSLSIPEGLMKAINLALLVSPTLHSSYVRSKITAKAGETRPPLGQWHWKTTVWLAICKWILNLSASQLVSGWSVDCGGWPLSSFNGGLHRDEQTNVLHDLWYVFDKECQEGGYHTSCTWEYSVHMKISTMYRKLKYVPAYKKNLCFPSFTPSLIVY